MEILLHHFSSHCFCERSWRRSQTWQPPSMPLDGLIADNTAQCVRNWNQGPRWVCHEWLRRDREFGPEIKMTTSSFQIRQVRSQQVMKRSRWRPLRGTACRAGRSCAWLRSTSAQHMAKGGRRKAHLWTFVCPRVWRLDKVTLAREEIEPFRTRPLRAYGQSECCHPQTCMLLLWAGPASRASVTQPNTAAACPPPPARAYLQRECA